MSKTVKPTLEHVEILNGAQLAGRLGMTRESLRKAISRGHVPAGRKIPGLGLRWRADEIDAWLAAKLPKRDPLP